MESRIRHGCYMAGRGDGAGRGGRENERSEKEKEEIGEEYKVERGRGGGINRRRLQSAERMKGGRKR